MSMPAAGEQHEFVVAAELAEVAERLGIPLHAGDRVRFEVIDGGGDSPARRRLGWLGSVASGRSDPSERASSALPNGAASPRS